MKFRKQNRRQLSNPFEIINSHFSTWSTFNHVNRKGLEVALSSTNQTSPFVFETGTSAYGTDSSRLFDLFTKNTKGIFHSVDINPKASRTLKFQHGKQTHFHIGDSVDFIKNHLSEITEHIDLCYLDSWDVDWSAPEASAIHGLNEFDAVKVFLHPGSILVIDDTPKDLDLIPKINQSQAQEYLTKHGVLPGKGSLVLKKFLKEPFGEILSHEFNLVIRMW